MKILDERIKEISLFIKEKEQKEGMTALEFADLPWIGKFCEKYGLEATKIFIAGSELPKAKKTFIFSVLEKIQETEIKDSFIVSVIIRGINGVLRYY